MISTHQTGKHPSGWHRIAAKMKSLSIPLRVMAGVLITVVLILVVLALIGISKITFDLELAKAMLDVGVVGVAGAFLAYLVEDHRQRITRMEKLRDDGLADQLRDKEAAQKKQQFREEALKLTLSRIVASYNQAKRARRNMRALGRTGEKGQYRLRVPGYDAIMIDVIDAQLELETIISDVKTSAKTYPSAMLILPGLEEMEGYLGKIIGEYEDERPQMQDDGKVSLEPLDKISDFIASHRLKPRFSTVYVKAHSAVRRAIRKDLLDLVGVAEEDVERAPKPAGPKAKRS